MFFLLGFTLFALIYAAMGSFVSRPDDLQTLSLPLSLVAMSGYLLAIMTLSRGASDITTMFSFIPPFSPFVMLARLMVDQVEPWEIAVVDRHPGPGRRLHRDPGDPHVRRRASCSTGSGRGSGTFIAAARRAG